MTQRLIHSYLLSSFTLASLPQKKKKKKLLWLHQKFRSQKQSLTKVQIGPSEHPTALDCAVWSTGILMLNN